MADINEILGRQINNVKELKKAINELQDSLIGVDTESEEFKTTSQQLAAAQAEYVKVTRAGKEENIAAKDSIVGLKNEYKALYDQYKMLTEEQRNSDFGKQMAESLNTLSTKINDTQKGVGAFKDNIGRYTEGVTDAFNQMGMSLGGLQKPMDLATKGTKTFGTALKGLAANPIVYVITALVAILVKVADSIKKNEELTNRLKEAMAVFRPILDGIANVFDFLAGLLVKTVEGLTKVAEKILSIIPGMKQAIQSHKDLAKATNDLTKAQRENSVVASQKNAEIERLREEASATDDVIEKKKLLEEAKALQAEVDQKNIELAQEELRILQEYGEKTANSAEENEKLAAAQKKVNDAIAQGERNMRQYNKQLDAATKGTKSATSAGKNWREEAKKLYEETIENSKTELQKLTEKYEKEKKLLEKYHYDTTQLTIKYNKDRSKILSEQFQKELAKEDAVWNNYVDNLTRFYTNLKQIYAGDPVGLQAATTSYLKDAEKELNKLMDDLHFLYGSEKDEIQELFSSLFGDDLTKIRDYNYVRELFERTFSLDDADQKKILYQFYTFSEETWTAFVDDMQQRLKELNETYGLNIKNWFDLELEGENGETYTPRATQLGHDIAASIGDGFKTGIEEIKKGTYFDKAIPDLFERLSGDLQIYQKYFDFLGQNTADKGAYEEFTEERLKKEYEMQRYLAGVYMVELEDFKGTQDQKVEILKEYYNIMEEIREKEAALATLQQERTAQMVESLIDLTDRMSSSMNSYRSTMESVIDSEVKQGKISEKEAERKKKNLLKLEAAETAFSIATITADAASGIFSIWKGYAQEKGIINPQAAAAAGPAGVLELPILNAKSLVSAIAQTASLASTAAAQIAAARGKYVTDSNNFHADAGGGTSVASVPTLISSEPYTYTQTIQNVDTEDELNKYNLFVSVTDIESGLAHKVQVTDETSF